MNAYYVSFFASLVDGVVSFPWSHILSLFSPTVLPYLLWWLGWGHILAESALPLVQSQNPFTLVVPGGHLTKTLCICHPSPGQLDHPALVAVQDCLSCFDSTLELPVACCQLQFFVSVLHRSWAFLTLLLCQTWLLAAYNYLLILFLLWTVFRLLPY